MHIKALPFILTSICFPSIGLAKSVDMSDSTRQETVRTQTLSFDLKGDSWLVNGKKRPVLETSLSGVNYMTLMNSSSSASLNLVIPRFEYSVLAKNDTAFAVPHLIKEDNAGNTLLWIEPNSRLTISFTNDLAQTPMQGIVTIFSSKPEVTAIFGPRASTGFTLTPTEKAEPMPLSKLGLNTFSQPKVVNKTLTTMKLQSGEKKLKAGHRYEIKNHLHSFKLEFADRIFVTKRNKYIGGSGYWSRSFQFFPEETLEFVTPVNTTLRVTNDL